MKHAAFLLGLSFFSMVLFVSCENIEKDYYGSVDHSLLSSLTWHDPDYKEGSNERIQRFETIPNYNNESSYQIKAYYGTAISDTFYRPDTSIFSYRTYQLYGDTLVSVDMQTVEKIVITKLTPEELIYYYIPNSFYRFSRSHKTLVTRGTGANLGKDTVDYHE
jgi:hypothetical protein